MRSNRSCQNAKSKDLTPLAVAPRAVAVLLLSAAVAAQSPPATQVPQFRAQADLIEVDVSVLDGNRRPVSGLTAADFSVTEDKVAQTISAFAEVQLSTPERVESAWRRSVPRDVESNRLGDRRLVVLFLDLKEEDRQAIEAVVKGR